MIRGSEGVWKIRRAAEDAAAVGSLTSCRPKGAARTTAIHPGNVMDVIPAYAEADSW